MAVAAAAAAAAAAAVAVAVVAAVVAVVAAVVAVAVAAAAVVAVVAVLPEGEKSTADWWQELAGRMGPKGHPQLELLLPLQGLVEVGRRSRGGQVQAQQPASALPQEVPVSGLGQGRRGLRAVRVVQRAQQHERRLAVRFGPQLRALRRSAARSACART